MERNRSFDPNHEREAAVRRAGIAVIRREFSEFIHESRLMFKHRGDFPEDAIATRLSTLTRIYDWGMRAGIQPHEMDDIAETEFKRKLLEEAEKRKAEEGL